MEEPPQQEVKVFIPHVCMQSKTGLLIGWKKRSAAKLCFTITAVAENEISPRKFQQHLGTYQLENKPQVIGLISTSVDNVNATDEVLAATDRSMSSEWIAFEHVDSKEPKVTLMGCEGRMNCDDIMVVVYDGDEVLSSVYLTDEVYSQINKQDPCENKTNINIISQSLCNYGCLRESVLRNFGKKPNGCTSFTFVDCIEKRTKIMHLLLGLIERIILSVCSIIISAIQFCEKGLPLYWPHGICNVPAVCTQLKTKYDQIKTAVNIQHASPIQRHRSRNLLNLHVFDMFLGMLLMFWLLADHRADKFSNLFMDWAENVAAYLQNLLQWMMGSPAGLKLNHQLSKLLGKFFTYHIYLWTGYLSVLRPVQVTILWVIAAAGILGLSVQLSLMRDLVSMMTLHIYCFYVYAARLYCLQMYALSSLWRLFRGKKWNVLRQRVDSATFDIDQLFIGTLFFTILLFLLPTTALYYVVFTALRLIVLTLQGTLYKAVLAINVLPVTSIIARVFFPSIISDRVKFTLIPKIPGRPLYLAMETQAASLMTIMTSLSQYDTRASSESWGKFVKKLFLGELVYPWIEPTKDKTD